MLLLYVLEEIAIFFTLNFTKVGRSTKFEHPVQFQIFFFLKRVLFDAMLS